MNVVENLAIVGSRVLAKKGSLYFIKLKNNCYSVDRITKSCACSLFLAEDRELAIDFFAEKCRKQRKGKGDFNLEIFARQA